MILGKNLIVAAGILAVLAAPVRAGEYDTGVAELRTHLGELDQTLHSLLNILNSVQIQKNRERDVHIQFFSKHVLKDGVQSYDLKPEQPMTDAFIGNWTAKNEYVPAQMARILALLRMPTGERATALKRAAKSNADELVRDLVARKKKDGTYDEARDRSVIEALVADVYRPSVRQADISQYLADQALMDRLLLLRKTGFNTPVALSKKILELVKTEGSSWSVAALRKTLFFVPVKKYFWELVGIIEARQGAPMNWIMAASASNANPALYEMLLGLAKQHANQPVQMGSKVWAFVQKNKATLSVEELEMCLHFTPDSSYARKILNLLNGQGIVGLAGFSAVGREVPLLSTNTVSRLISMSGDLVGMFERNPMGSPQMDRYYDVNSELSLLRQDNNQGGERWLTPCLPIHTSGDNGAFVFSFFNQDGVPVGFARRSELTNSLYFYDLEANLVGVSRQILGQGGQTETLYAGEFYSLF